MLFEDCASVDIIPGINIAFQFPMFNRLGAILIAVAMIGTSPSLVWAEDTNAGQPVSCAQALKFKPLERFVQAFENFTNTLLVVGKTFAAYSPTVLTGKFLANRKSVKAILKILADTEEKNGESNVEVDPNLEPLKAPAKSLLQISRAYSLIAKTFPKIYASIVLGAVALNTPSVMGLDRPDDIDSLQPNEFELIYTFPFPHQDLRIGDTVYTYSTAFIYDESYEEYMEGLLTTTARVRIEVSEAEVKALKEFMEHEVGKKYVWAPYFTMFSCVSATNRAIEHSTGVVIPAGIDRSPALTRAWLKALQLSGDTRIKNVYFTGEYVASITQFAISAIDATFTTVLLPENAAAAQLDYFPNSFGEGN